MAASRNPIDSKSREKVASRATLGHGLIDHVGDGEQPLTQTWSVGEPLIQTWLVAILTR